MCPRHQTITTYLHLRFQSHQETKVALHLARVPLHLPSEVQIVKHRRLQTSWIYLTHYPSTQDIHSAVETVHRHITNPQFKTSNSLMRLTFAVSPPISPQNLPLHIFLLIPKTTPQELLNEISARLSRILSLQSIQTNHTFNLLRALVSAPRLHQKPRSLPELHHSISKTICILHSPFNPTP